MCSNAIVYRAVKLVAENVGGCALLVEEGAETRDRHPLLDLIARPNPRQDGAQFLESVATHLLLAGNAYVEAVAHRWHAARTARAASRPHEARARRRRLARGLRIHGRRPHGALRPERRARRRSCISSLMHPLDDHYGLAPLEAAAVAVDTHNAAANWNKALLDNAARPSGALVYAGAGRRGDVRRAVRAARSASSETTTRARAMPAARCCSKAGSTGRRCRCRRRTWISWRRSTPPRARSRSPSACRRSCSAFRATTPTRTTRKRTACSSARPCCPSRTASPARLRTGSAPRSVNARLHRRCRPDRRARADRAALWSRITDAPFLTLNEKRAVVGYAPLEGGDRLE